MSTTRTSISEPPPPPEIALYDHKTVAYLDSALWSLQSARFHIMVMLGCITMILGMIRGSISMVIVCMTAIDEASSQSHDPNTSEASTNQRISHNTILTQPHWSIDQQALVHAGFYFGSLLVVFPSHHLVKRYRAKRILTCSLIFCGAGSLVTPWAALSHSYWLVAVVRVITGLGNGLCVPCGFAIVTKWFPRAERNIAFLIFALGEHIGIFCSMVFTAVFCRTKIGGWPVASELYGLFALVLLVVWELRAAHKPRYSSYVTASELEHIRGKRIRRSRFHVSTQLPLKQLLLSPCVIAICLCCFVHSLIISGLIAFLPLFNHLALHMDLQQNVISSGVPFLFQAMAEALFHFSGRFMQRTGISVTTTVKFLTSIATFGAASCFLSIALLRSKEKTVTTAIVTLAVGVMSAYTVGYKKYATTVAPQFTRFVLLYLHMYSQLAGVVSPILIAVLISKGIGRELLLSLLVTFMLSAFIIFLIFAHGRREVYVDSYRNTTSTFEQPVTLSERQIAEEIVHTQLPVQSAIARSPPAVTYHEGEVHIPLRPTELSRDVLEDEFTSDDEY